MLNSAAAATHRVMLNSFSFYRAVHLFNEAVCSVPVNIEQLSASLPLFLECLNNGNISAFYYVQFLRDKHSGIFSGLAPTHVDITTRLPIFCAVIQPVEAALGGVTINHQTVCPKTWLTTSLERVTLLRQSNVLRQRVTDKQIRKKAATLDDTIEAFIRKNFLCGLAYTTVSTIRHDLHAVYGDSLATLMPKMYSCFRKGLLTIDLYMLLPDFYEILQVWHRSALIEAAQEVITVMLPAREEITCESFGRRFLSSPQVQSHAGAQNVFGHTSVCYRARDPLCLRHCKEHQYGYHIGGGVVMLAVHKIELY